MRDWVAGVRVASHAGLYVLKHSVSCAHRSLRRHAFPAAAGSRQLGVPTANLPPEPLAQQLAGLPDGVYFGCGFSQQGL